VRYLILAAGTGKRMRRVLVGRPKCLIDVAGEPLIARLLRQIREADPSAEVDVVLGFCSDLVEPLLAGCRIVINPFFDITGINASLWFARAAFEQAVTVLHGDLVLSDELAAALFGADAPSLVAYDSSILDPKEINVLVDGDRIRRFGVNFAGYSGAYVGAFRLAAPAARLFADTLERRIRRGFNDSRTYYFFVMRRLIAEPSVTLVPFDFARFRWQEIDCPADLSKAEALFGRRAESGIGVKQGR
jgi:choline kinase